MNIQELESRIDQLTDPEVEADDNLLDDILLFAKSDEDGFSAFVNSQELGHSSCLPVLYEALMDDAKGWEPFLLSQLKRVIHFFETVDSDEDDASLLYYLTCIDGLNSAFYHSSIELLRDKLASKSLPRRKAALEYIVELIARDQSCITNDLSRQLHRELTDENFEIRLNAFIYLKEENLLPPGHKQSFTDWIRTKVSPAYRQHLELKRIEALVAKEIIRGKY